MTHNQHTPPDLDTVAAERARWEAIAKPYADEIVELMAEDNASPADVYDYVEEAEADHGEYLADLVAQMVEARLGGVDAESPERCEHPTCFGDRCGEPEHKGTCPADGEQAVVDPGTRPGSTGGSDPYGIEYLACGHGVIGFGPAVEDLCIVSGPEVEVVEVEDPDGDGMGPESDADFADRFARSLGCA